MHVFIYILWDEYLFLSYVVFIERINSVAHVISARESIKYLRVIFECTRILLFHKLFWSKFAESSQEEAQWNIFEYNL